MIVLVDRRSIILFRINVNSRILDDFDKAVRFIKQYHVFSGLNEEKAIIEKLLTVLDPITTYLSSELAMSVAIDEQNIVSFIKEIHLANWTQYSEDVSSLVNRLHSNSITFTNSDFEILDDIGDALESECAHLVRRMGNR